MLNLNMAMPVTNNKLPGFAAQRLEPLNAGVVVRPAAVQAQLLQVENSFTRFNTAFMKSPRLKKELVKCRQLLQMKARCLAPHSPAGLNMIAHLNTRDKLKHIYQYSTAEQGALGGQVGVHQIPESPSTQLLMAGATASVHAATPGEPEGTTSSQGLHASPERAASADSQDQVQYMDLGAASAFAQPPDSPGPRPSAARLKEPSARQAKARFVNLSRPDVSNPGSPDRSVESRGRPSVDRGSRTSK